MKTDIFFPSSYFLEVFQFVFQKLIVYMYLTKWLIKLVLFHTILYELYSR